ncbi:MAG: response regulator [Enterobacterales bacterium]|nr:response regulator [Enterobacterales bacterium]
MSQLSKNFDSLESQYPLLRRLGRRLLTHCEKIQLGVKPQSEKPAVLEPPKNTGSDLEKVIEEQGGTPPFASYGDKGQLIFVENTPEVNEEFCKPFASLGIDTAIVKDLPAAIKLVSEDSDSIIVAGLDLVEDKDVQPDDVVEENGIPLIFIADEDNQKNRAKAIRNGGTGFIITPVSVASLCEQIERLHDLHIDTHRRILVMEDSKAQARYYEKVLMKGPFDVLVVNDPDVLLEALRGFDPETVLMDMQMPGSSGVELTKMIRQMPRYAHLPIIFLSAEENMRKQNQALMSGGTAFIVKPVEKEQLMFMTELYTQRFRDLSPQIEVNPDTNLLYSPQFMQMIAVETARMTRSASTIALAIVHLDDSENFSSDANYSFLNNAIQHLAGLLRQRLRKTDIIGHLSRGRLAVILTSGQHPDWLEILKDVQQQFAKLPFSLRNEDKHLSVSIGVSELATKDNAHKWLEKSRDALSIALADGSSGIHFATASSKVVE